MAKRMRMDTCVSAKDGGSQYIQEKAPEPILRAYEIQQLMNGPEADKIFEFDKEMQAIMTDKGLSVDEKMRKFERALANFRKVQGNIISNGGVSLIRDASRFTDDERDALKVIIANVVHEVLEESQPGQRAVVMSNGQVAGQAALQATSQAVPSSDTPQAAPPAMAAQGQKKSTPTQAKPTHAGTQPSKAETDVKSPTAQITDFLVQKGMVQTNNRYVIPDNGSAGATKRKFAARTFQRALNHLLAPEWRDVPYQTAGILKAIQNVLKDSEVAGELKAKFPNLQRMLAPASSKDPEQTPAQNRSSGRLKGRWIEFD